MNISWEDAQVFLAVNETGSFSSAAQLLSLGQPTISRKIKSLEEKLKSQLFERGKYGARPTAAALKLLPAAQQMANWAGEFERIAQGEDHEVSGTVRIAAPPGIAVELLAPSVPIMQRHLPLIQFEVLSSIQHLDLSRGEADLAIRTKPPHEPELVAIAEHTVPVAVFGAKSYVANLKQPCNWTDLHWISWAKPYLDLPPRPLLEKAIQNFTPVFTSDDYLVQKAAMQAGVGALITSQSLNHVEGDQDVIKIDIGIELPPAKFYIVCAKSMRHVARVKAVIEMFEELLNRNQ